jgi:hypothetical protein
MAAPTLPPNFGRAGIRFWRSTLHPAENATYNEKGNKELDIVVRTLIRMYRTLFGVSTNPPGVANPHRAIDIPDVVKFVLTVTTFGHYMVLIPMAEPLAEKMARDSEGAIHAFLAFRDNPDIDPNGETYETFLTSPQAPDYPFLVAYDHDGSGKKHMIFTTTSPRILVSFLDTLLGAGRAFENETALTRPPAHERFRRI